MRHNARDRLTARL